MSRKSIQVVSTGILVLGYLFLSGCGHPRSQLEHILQRGEIRIATYGGPATYYTDKDGETGLEFELATRFARHLSLELSLTITKNSAEANELVQRGWADIAAGGLGRAKSSDASLIYGPGYQWLTRQIVYRISHKRPTSLDDIHPHQLNIADGTVPVSTLEKLRKKSPSLSWHIHSDKNNNDLLALLEKDEIRYALAFSNDIILARASMPEIRPAFTVTDPQPLAWAIKNSNDYSLLESIESFQKEMVENGTLADLIERFYGPTGFFDYVDSRRFINKIKSRLPDLESYFRHSADRHNFDWRLLAALSYQESHWNKNARSHTGVRGLMMLTQPTARQLGVDNRLDPEQSIEGGTKYLSSLLQRLPERISEPDRTWFALAAYNVGFGHLEDARVLTDKDGDNPDSWQQVKLRLPLLSKRRWYKQTRHGYARGQEPVKFVRKIIKYYYVLVQLTQKNQERAPVLVDSIIINSPVL